MPKDAWARAAARDRGRQALRSGEYYRIDKPAKRHKQARNARPAADEPEPCYCGKCRSADVSRSTRRFKDGTTHIEVRCAKCRRFIKWEGR